MGLKSDGLELGFSLHHTRLLSFNNVICYSLRSNIFTLYIFKQVVREALQLDQLLE